MKPVQRRKICFPIMNRIHYARQKRLLQLLNRHPQIELQLVVGGSVLLDKYGHHFFSAIKADGFRVEETLFNIIEGGNHVTMAKTAGLTALEFANLLHKLNSDIVLIRGDRFEQMAIAMVAAYINKTVAHIEGGDLSGSIDESVRHAITKLAHIHFVTNNDARKRVIQMGEHPKYVFNVGSPDVEFASLVKKRVDSYVVNNVGLGHEIDFREPYLMVMQHPVTTEYRNREYEEILLEAVDDLNMQTIWFWPNIDAGTAEMAKAIRVYRESGQLKNNKIRFIIDLLPEDFIAVLKNAGVLVGNSSAGIKESSYFGIPVVNIGTRQNQRLRAQNVLDVGHAKTDVAKAIKKQISHGKYRSSNLYFKPNTSRKIVDVLVNIPLFSQKSFYN